jgi:hypothetical protein
MKSTTWQALSDTGSSFIYAPQAVYFPIMAALGAVNNSYGVR